MTSSTPLPPHLEQFIREQIAAGRYHSEGDVIRAALHLLEASRLPGGPSGPRATQPATGPPREPAGPAAAERWVSPGEWRTGAAASTSDMPRRRSPRGLLADLRSGLSFDEIQDARSEMWAGLRHDGA